jgi:DNA-nicking Smr family endonuclease
LAKKKSGSESLPPVPDEDVALFREAVGDVLPLRPSGRRLPPFKRLKPIPLLSMQDDQQVLVDSLSDHIPWAEAMETGEELAFLRPGLARQTLRRLRGGHWIIQAELDLHGHTSDEARLRLAEFLNQCKKRGLRCIRIIHGKGLRSKNKEPVLKIKVKNWLIQREEVLAFCQARPADGGSGAALVLLKAAA